MQYEAGLSVGSDYKVRAPLSVNPDGAINFACLMIEGCSDKNHGKPEQGVPNQLSPKRLLLPHFALPKAQSWRAQLCSIVFAEI